jgi:hypothetical protein
MLEYWGELEIEELSMSRSWGVPGRMFTGLVGVDMSVGERKERLVVGRTRRHVCMCVILLDPEGT